jgi:hypothetical protein
MTIDTSGNVGIGTTQPSTGRLDVEGGDSIALYVQSDHDDALISKSFTHDGVVGESTSGRGVEGGSDSGDGVLGESSGGSGAAGVRGVNTNSGGFAGLFEGRVRVTVIPPTDGSDSGDVCFNPQGNLMNCRTSSLRYKTNVQPFLEGLDIVRRLRPISFNWKESGIQDVGLGAEEVARVAPEFTSASNGEVVGVKYNRLNLLLINAIKEQQAEIERQSRQITRLQSRVTQLEHRRRAGRR